MLIMNKDKVVARAVYNSVGVPIAVEAEPDALKSELPYALFSPFIDGGIRKVTYEDFLYWVKRRCFPEGRSDKARLLADLGLSEYDEMEIVYRTNAKMHLDNFWVDWESK